MLMPYDEFKRIAVERLKEHMKEYDDNPEAVDRYIKKFEDGLKEEYEGIVEAYKKLGFMPIYPRALAHDAYMCYELEDDFELWHKNK